MNEKMIEVPSELTGESRRAAQAIADFINSRGMTDTGGDRVFVSPEEWAERGEEYGTRSLLIVIHDGGIFAPYFNLDYMCYEMNDMLIRHLAKHGLYAEQCTTWYSAIYPA